MSLERLLSDSRSLLSSLVWTGSEGWWLTYFSERAVRPTWIQHTGHPPDINQPHTSTKCKIPMSCVTVVASEVLYCFICSFFFQLDHFVATLANHLLLVVTMPAVTQKLWAWFLIWRNDSVLKDASKISISSPSSSSEVNYIFPLNVERELIYCLAFMASPFRHYGLFKRLKCEMNRENSGNTQSGLSI